MPSLSLKTYQIHTQNRFTSLRMALMNGLNQTMPLTAQLSAVSNPSEAQELYLALNVPPYEEPAPGEPEPPYTEPMLDYYQDVLALGPRVIRIADMVVRGAAGPEVEYRVLPHFDWTPSNTERSLPMSDEVSQLEFRVKLTEQRLKDTDPEGTPRPPQQKFFGLSVTVTQEEQFGTVTQPPADMNVSVPVGWLAPGKTHRALAYGQLVPRHPDMPIGMGGVLVYNMQGTQINPTRRGELLCLPDKGPHVCYWTPDQYSMPLPNIPESQYQAVYMGLARGNWGASEHYKESRNVVVPRFQVSIGGVDYTSHVVDFSPNSVTLAGPASVFENIPNSVQTIQVSGQSMPIYTGRAVRADTRPYANGRVTTFQVLYNTEFYDADLSRVNMENEPLPEGEGAYVLKLLEKAGYQGTLEFAQDIRIRTINFWHTPMPDGPGMELAEVESRYQNTQNSSTLGTIKTVLQANLLDVFDLPNGNMLVDTLIPKPEKTLPELLKEAPMIYCASSGSQSSQPVYVNDPRINISQVSLALDDGFAETEVEAFSNEIDLKISRGLADFVQAYKPSNILELTIGGYESYREWPLEQFQTMENNILKGRFYPYEWFIKAQVDPNSSAIEDTRTYQSGGFMGGGNKSVVRKDLVFMTAEEAAVKWPTFRNDIQMFVDQFMPAEEIPGTAPKYDTPQKRMQNTRLATGVGIALKGDYVSKATFQFKVNVGKPNEALMSVLPLLGKYDARFAPDWFPPTVVTSILTQYKDLKPRGVKKVTNPMIARIGSKFAVQKPRFRDNRVTDQEYDENWATTANQLATWLTVRDVLSTRRVELSIAGAQAVLPNQFIFIARRPSGGPGKPITHVDALLTLEPGKPDARVGSEAWTRIQCAYIGTVVNNESFYDMPIGWGATWQE